MSTQIPVAFEVKFAQDFYILSQQKGSRLRSTVRTDSVAGGKYFYFDRVGATGMVKKTSRHQETPIIDTPHSRRRVSPETYVWADYVDRADALRMSKTPNSTYMTVGMAAAGRQMDDLIIAALNGNATSVDQDDAASTVALPSAQKVAAASAGLTLSKILEAQRILDAAEVDEEDRYFIYSARQKKDLLAISQVTSADFQTVKALSSGNVPQGFMGFNWIRSERLTSSGTTRFCLAYAKRAVGLYIPEDVTARVSEIPTRMYSTQLYAEMDLGAVRIEDAGVVQIACVES